jgi:hypothetical protein
MPGKRMDLSRKRTPQAYRHAVFKSKGPLNEIRRERGKARRTIPEAPGSAGIRFDKLRMSSSLSNSVAVL